MEYGTPNIASVGLPRPELSPLKIPLPTSSIITDDNNQDIDLSNSQNNSDSNKDNSPVENINTINWKEEVNFDIKRGKFNHIYIPFFDIKGINNFFFNLDKSFFYTLIPIFSMYGIDENPHIILSKQILIIYYSNPILIKDYLNK